jgi:hypothetical protein
VVRRDVARPPQDSSRLKPVAENSSSVAHPTFHECTRSYVSGS